MPRRAVLSDEQRMALLALPDDETTLVQHWTLSEDDLAIIVRRTRYGQCLAGRTAYPSRPEIGRGRAEGGDGRAGRRTTQPWQAADFAVEGGHAG